MSEQIHVYEPEDDHSSQYENGVSDKHIWKEIGYTVQPKILPGVGVVSIAGFAYGTRDDDGSYYCSYDLPVIYPEGFDWTRAARERLDSFLDPQCSCSKFGVCSYHQLKGDQWTREDAERNRIAAAEVPGPLKKLIGSSLVRNV